jgi:hypothetical protein
VIPYGSNSTLAGRRSKKAYFNWTIRRALASSSTQELSIGTARSYYRISTAGGFRTSDGQQFDPKREDPKVGGGRSDFFATVPSVTIYSGGDDRFADFSWEGLFSPAIDKQ